MSVTYEFPAHKVARAGLVRAIRFAHVVEGKSVTTRQISEKLGISMDVALRRALRGPFPLTWSALSTPRITGLSTKAASNQPSRTRT